jgi:hypothetical protein
LCQKKKGKQVIFKVVLSLKYDIHTENYAKHECTAQWIGKVL